MISLLGMGDFSIFAAYALCVLSALACVVYGIINWNKGGETEDDLKKDKEWEQKEKEISENLDI